MAKEEILQCWIAYIGHIIEHHLITMGRAIDKEKLFQYPLPEQLWINIGNFIENLARRPFWIDRQASSTIFGGKQTSGFWQTIFENGTSASGHKVMPSGLNIMDMIKA
jgi:DNA-directed RNA polymerase beta subunit